MAIAYRIKERLRDFYATFDPDEARQLLVELQGHYLRRAMPPEVQSSVGRSACGSTSSAPTTWPGWVPNGPTEATNDLIKRIKRIGFGFCNFENYRIRALLHAAKRTGVSWARSSSGEGRDPPESEEPDINRTRVGDHPQHSSAPLGI